MSWASLEFSQLLGRPQRSCQKFWDADFCQTLKPGFWEAPSVAVFLGPYLGGWGSWRISWIPSDIPTPTKWVDEQCHQQKELTRFQNMATLGGSLLKKRGWNLFFWRKLLPHCDVSSRIEVIFGVGLSSPPFWDSRWVQRMERGALYRDATLIWNMEKSKHMKKSWVCSGNCQR